MAEEITPDLDQGISIAEAQALIANLEEVNPDQPDRDSDTEESEEVLAASGEAEEPELEDDEESLESEEEAVEALADEDIDDEDEEGTSEDVYAIKIDGTEVEVTLDELQKGYSRQASFTRKSQALAEERKAFETEQSSVTTERQQYAQLLGALQNQLASQNEAEPDWENLYDQDPIEATRQERQWRQRQGQRVQKFQAIQAEQKRLAEQRQTDEQKALSEIVTEERARLPELIPDWKNEETAEKERAELRTFLNANGISDEEVSSLIKADHIAVLRMAMLYSRGAKRTSKAKAATRKGRTVRPGSANSTPKKATQQRKRAEQRLSKSGRIADAVDLVKDIL